MINFISISNKLKRERFSTLELPILDLYGPIYTVINEQTKKEIIDLDIFLDLKKERKNFTIKSRITPETYESRLRLKVCYRRKNFFKSKEALETFINSRTKLRVKPSMYLDLEKILGPDRIIVYS